MADDEGAPDAPAGAAAAAAAAGNPPPMMLPQSEMSRLVIFRGNSKDTVTAEAWADMVDRHITVLNWTTKQTAGAAIESMRDDANIWRENLNNSSDGVKRALLENWQAMRKEFLKRFGKAKTWAAKVHGLAQLRQAQGESCGTYQDRVVHTLDKLTAVKMKDQAGQAATGFTACRDLFETAIFLNGLKGELRMYVEMDLEDETTTVQVYDLARKTEIAVNSRSGAQHKVAMLDGASDGKLEALRVEMTDLKKKVTTEQVGAVEKKRAPKAGQRDKPMKDRRPMLCWKCKQWGKHLSKECKLTVEEIARLTPMTKDDKPAGPVSDAQYPNA